MLLNSVHKYINEYTCLLFILFSELPLSECFSVLTMTMWKWAGLPLNQGSDVSLPPHGELPRLWLACLSTWHVQTNQFTLVPVV